MTIPVQIILNGQQISIGEILRLTPEISGNPDVPDWEKELYLFLNEWFSDSDFVLAQTSGSTGEPKLIELPKSIMIKSAERTIEYFGLQPGDKLLHSLPCRYIAGKMMAVRAIVGQMNLIAVDPASDFNFLQNESFDLAAMVPNQVFKLLEQPSGKSKLQNIRNLLVGGSAISTALEAQISQLSTRVVSTYGMTETASHIAIRDLSGSFKSDYYHCLPGISVNLNEAGCLQIYLPEFGEPLQTNDLADVQSETSFRILGRADSVIISGGIKFSPELIEKKLEGLISERFIISSVPDEKLGEKLVLVIEGKPYSTKTLEQQLAELLPSFEQPKAIVFLDKFQETASGKIIRKAP
ncbi:MAG: AMP-binding protein [Bacteroidota bacterium]|nr:acyl-CoA synthetase [Odoribacter sp.]MDP3643713.1 AMP-binding protein [Bacteroidota bacterium]